MCVLEFRIRERKVKTTVNVNSNMSIHLFVLSVLFFRRLSGCLSLPRKFQLEVGRREMGMKACGFVEPNNKTKIINYVPIIMIIIILEDWYVSQDFSRLGY